MPICVVYVSGFLFASKSEGEFLDAGLRTLDRLEQAVRSQLGPKATTMTGSRKVQIPGKGTDGGNPAEFYDEPADRPLSAEEKQSILDAAVEEISRRREILKAHAAEMYAALVKTFPVNEI